MATHNYVVATPGDADLDGDVDSADLNAVGFNWRMEVESWSQGDFNGDRVVNVADLNLLAMHWRLGAPVTAAGSPVPRGPLKGLLNDEVNSDGVTGEVTVAVGTRVPRAPLAEHVDAVMLQDAFAQPRHNRPRKLHGEVASVVEARDVISHETFAYRRWRHHTASGTLAHDKLRLADIEQELVDDVLRRDW